MVKKPHRSSRSYHQKGVYAVEFALVFTLFFALIYAAICYSLLFTYRMTLQAAAEDSARAALKVQVIGAGELQADNRRAIATRVARARVAAWLPPRIQIDDPEVMLCIKGGAGQGGAVCGTAATTACVSEPICEIVVMLRVSGINEIFPALIPMPQAITAQASLPLTRRTL